VQFYYRKEIKAFNKNRLHYLVIGGIAVNLYGLQRLTLDLDLMIDLSPELLEKFVKIMEKLGYGTKVPQKKWAKVMAIAFVNQQDNDKRIDVFLKNPIDFTKAYKRRKVFKVEGLSISCVSFEDLIDLKNKASRTRDLIDIGSLKRLKKLENQQ